ncbi:MAG: helix-turn-helix domain-containing protein [Chloroflexaceae bacterium]
MGMSKIKSSSLLAERFGEHVRQLRQQKGITSQEALADLAGLHRTFIGRVERGETNITLENIRRIATALDVSLAELSSTFQDIEDATDHT